MNVTCIQTKAVARGSTRSNSSPLVLIVSNGWIFDHDKSRIFAKLTQRPVARSILRCNYGISRSTQYGVRYFYAIYVIFNDFCPIFTTVCSMFPLLLNLLFLALYG